MNEKLLGRCLCGAVTVEAEGPPKRVSNCHCRSCQRFTSSAFATFADFDADKVTFGGDGLKKIESSPGVKRYFCGTCGCSVGFFGDKWPYEICIHASIFDEGHELSPGAHDYIQDKLPWIRLDDGLKCHQRFSGSG